MYSFVAQIRSLLMWRFFVEFFAAKNSILCRKSRHIRSRGSRIGVCVKDGDGLPLTFIPGHRGTRRRMYQACIDKNKLLMIESLRVR
jgi:hypothetical protein